mgnify:CR=1 FL=1
MAEEFRQMIRLLEKDLNGNLQTQYALTRVYGIKYSLSNAICILAQIDKAKKIGSLSDEELEKIQTIIKNPSEIPSWALNRNKDQKTGKDTHLIGADLKFNKDTDIKHLRKIKCYRGIRHSLGLPVRGQRTRSNFRKGKTVGVKKKSLKTASGKK